MDHICLTEGISNIFRYPIPKDKVQENCLRITILVALLMIYTTIINIFYVLTGRTSEDVLSHGLVAAQHSLGKAFSGISALESTPQHSYCNHKCNYIL